MVAREEITDLEFDEANHLYTLGGEYIPGVTRILEATGMINYDFLGDRREFYLERGRQVHRATEQDDHGRLDPADWSDSILGYVEGWRAFRRDFGFYPNRIEQRVCNRLIHYAGTLDRTGVVRDGGELIVDIKSGIAPPAVRHQLAAYAACLPHPRTRRRRCVEVHANGTYRVIAFDTGDYQRDFETFCLAVRLFNEALEEAVL